jgi:hypothetical protein
MPKWFKATRSYFSSGLSDKYNPKDVPSWIEDTRKRANLEGFLYDEFDTLGLDAQPFFAMKLLLYCLDYKKNYEEQTQLGILIINYQMYLMEGGYGYVKCVSDASKKKVKSIYEYVFSEEFANEHQHESNGTEREPNITERDSNNNKCKLNGTELDAVIDDINRKIVPSVLERYRKSQTLWKFAKKLEEQKETEELIAIMGFG